MALPLAPIAGFALRYGAVALTAYAVAARTERGRRDQRAEDALDELQEGVSWRAEDQQLNTTLRFRRVIRLGESGPGLEIDSAGISRIRIRKV